MTTPTRDIGAVVLERLGAADFLAHVAYAPAYYAFVADRGCRAIYDEADAAAMAASGAYAAAVLAIVHLTDPEDRLLALLKCPNLRVREDALLAIGAWGESEKPIAAIREEEMHWSFVQKVEVKRQEVAAKGVTMDLVKLFAAALLAAVHDEVKDPEIVRALQARVFQAYSRHIVETQT